MAISLQEILTKTADGAIEIMPLAEGGQAWLDYLNQDPAADICQHYAWGNIFTETFGLDSVLIVHRSNGKIDGGLPLIIFDQRITGRAMVSMPFLNYGGLLGADGSVKSAILEQARQIVSQTGADYLEMRHTAHGLGSSADYTKQNRSTFRLHLNRPADDIFRNFKKQLRTRIRKAEDQGLTIWQGRDRLDHFYGLFARAMGEHGTPVMPKRFFAVILQYLSDYVQMMIAYKDDRPIGGKLVLKFKNRATMTWGCYPDRYKHLMANYLLTWELIKQLAGGPIQTLDFGRSALDSGGYIYKANWGTDVIPIYVDYIASDKHKIPLLKPENVKYRAAINLWKKLPLSITKMIGPRLARYFP